MLLGAGGNTSHAELMGVTGCGPMVPGKASGPVPPSMMLCHGSPGVGYSRHDLVEVGEILLRGMQVQHGAGVPAQLPVPGDAAGLRGCKRRVTCPGASWAEQEGGQAPGWGVFAGPWEEWVPHKGARHRQASPQPSSPSPRSTVLGVVGSKGSPHPNPAAGELLLPLRTWC